MLYTPGVIILLTKPDLCNFFELLFKNRKLEFKKSRINQVKSVKKTTPGVNNTRME